MALITSQRVLPMDQNSLRIPRAHSLGGLAKASANVVAADKQAPLLGLVISKLVMSCECGGCG